MFEKFVVKISTGNAAFEDDLKGETIRILREIIDRIESGEGCGSAVDENGNKVGLWGFLTTK